MSPQKPHSRTTAFLDFYACFLLPAYTLLFAGSVEWFSTNFSVRAVLGEDYYRGFVLWGLLAGAYFMVLLTRLAATFPGMVFRLGMSALTLAACACLIYAILIPYLPDQFPSYAQLHVALAFTSCVLMMLALLLILLRCRREDRTGYRHLFRAWWGIVLSCGVLFALAGIISSALEVFFTLAAAQLTRLLWLRRQYG